MQRARRHQSALHSEVPCRHQGLLQARQDSLHPGLPRCKGIEGICEQSGWMHLKSELLIWMSPSGRLTLECVAERQHCWMV